MVVCQGGHVSFWSSEGQRMKRFNEQNVSETIDTTCLGFDEFGEKFYTGATDGKIRVRTIRRCWPSVMSAADLDLEFQWTYSAHTRCGTRYGSGNNTDRSLETAHRRRRLDTVGFWKCPTLLVSALHCRQLAVFRDIHEAEGRPSLPTEWKEEKDRNKVSCRSPHSPRWTSHLNCSMQGHEDDIICMAVTSFSPQLLASGSTDGEICVWNTSSESFIRRLDQRKRNSDSTQAEVMARLSTIASHPHSLLHQMRDDASDFGITTLRFLDQRMTSSTAHSFTGANLVSCGGIAFVRFWNTYTGKLVGEFQAHMDGEETTFVWIQPSYFLLPCDISGKYHYGSGRDLQIPGHR